MSSFFFPLCGVCDLLHTLTLDEFSAWEERKLVDLGGGEKNHSFLPLREAFSPWAEERSAAANWRKIHRKGAL